MKNLVKIIIVTLLGSFLFTSCESDEALASYVNPNQSDTTGNNIKFDLFVSMEVENIPVSYANGFDKYANWTISEQQGFCGTTANGVLQSHITSFIVPNSLKGSVYIDIKGCVNNDNATSVNVIDSVLVIGPYALLPKMKENRGAMVRYIDQDSVLWSTAFGGNLSSFSRFELSAIEDNGYDNFSQKIAWGKFEGYLYNGMGDSLKLKNGKFKGRIVQ